MPVVVSRTGASAGAILQVEIVESPYFRDWWLRSAWTGASYTLEAYRTRSDAEAQQSLMASATHAAGELVVTLTLAGGAPFNATPFRVRLTASGTWTQAIVGWVAAAETLLIDRVAAVLELYRQPNEALAGARKIETWSFLPTSLPALGVVLGGTLVDAGPGGPFMDGRVALDLFAAEDGLNKDRITRSTIDLACALRAVAIGEQARWGGMALNTEMRGVMQTAEWADDGSLVRYAVVPISVQLVDFRHSIDPNNPEVLSGGKYALSL